jgi:hypothetical protein
MPSATSLSFAPDFAWQAQMQLWKSPSIFEWSYAEYDARAWLKWQVYTKVNEIEAGNQRHMT